MSLPDLSRRSFLALTGGVILLGACRNDGGAADGERDDALLTGATAAVVSSDLFVSDEMQRFAFAVFAKEGYASGKPARVAIAPPGKAPTELVDATPRAEGLPEFRGVYTVERVFDVAGTWAGRLEYQSEASSFLFVVNSEPTAPAPGEPARSAGSPTADAALGVDPICTREPPCPLHTLSLDSLIGKGRPVVVMFATPALCRTRYCGPVLDALMPIAEDHSGEVDTVHVEIYSDRSGKTAAPTVEAWDLPSEPWLFGIDPTGTVISRIDGAFDATEIRAVYAALTS